MLWRSASRIAAEVSREKEFEALFLIPSFLIGLDPPSVLSQVSDIGLQQLHNHGPTVVACAQAITVET